MSDASTSGAEEGVLSGLRVIDAASFIAGPVAATVMADFGAEVIKIEGPGGDPFRRSATNPGSVPCEHPYNWIVDNRNKKSVVLDLKADEGREALYRLVETADVFVTNMPMGVRERLKIRWEDLEPLNERLIYASLTAYGETGPEAGRTGFDSTALWARTGLMDLCKPSPDSAPARSLPGMGDHPTGISLYGAVMTALFRRERTGKGGKVASSLLTNGLWWNALWNQAALFGSEVKGRPAREEADNPLHNLYRSKDGRWFHLIMITQQDRWQEFAGLIGRPGIGEDPRFATTAERIKHGAELIPELDAAFAAEDMAHWREVLGGNGFTFGEIAQIEDIRHDEQMVASGALKPIDDPELGQFLTVDTPMQVDGAAKMPARPMGPMGSDTEAVLRSVGYDDARLAALRAASVIPAN